MQTPEVETHRVICQKCLRPQSVCYCGRLQRISTATKVVLLQHPRERRVPVSTARMAHLSLTNSELHHGVDFGGDARVTALTKEPDTYVLFPGEGAVAPELLRDRPPKNLIVVDGTWPLAKKVIRLNPVLQTLPRIGFQPRRPSNYRIRKEPADHCVSTIEAVCEVLGALEGDHDRFDRMLGAFEYMVDRQLGFVESRVGGTRYMKHKGPPKPRVPTLFREEAANWVVVYGEANAHPRGTGFDGPGEVIHLVAQRVASGESFEAVIAPRRPLSDGTPFHIDVPAETLLSGERVEEALARFRAFLRPSDRLAAWGGGFVGGLLTAEGEPEHAWMDLRMPVMRLLRGRPGGIEAAAEKLKEPLGAHWARGRAGRRGAGLAAVVRALVRHSGELSSLAGRSA